MRCRGGKSEDQDDEDDDDYDDDGDMSGEKVE